MKYFPTSESSLELCDELNVDVFCILILLFLFYRNVLPECQAADPEALDVAHGVPPPRAAPALLRRVVLNRWTSSCSSLEQPDSQIDVCRYCRIINYLLDVDMVDARLCC